MKDYNEFPPLKYFIRVLKNCPKSAFLYTQLWKKRSPYMKISAHKKDVRKDYLISPTLFRNLLSPLMLLNLIYFTESDEKFQIEVMGMHVND